MPPLKIGLMPTSVPISQVELEGHCFQIKMPRKGHDAVDQNPTGMPDAAQSKIQNYFPARLPEAGCRDM